MRLLIKTELARARFNAGFSSAKKAAEEIGINYQHLLNIERGRTGASDPVWEIMARLYQVPADELKAMNLRAQKVLMERRLRAIA